MRNELQTAIRDSRVLVLLWSEPASRSRWVLAEVFTAFHLDRFIVTCALDATPVPQFLGNSAYLALITALDSLRQLYYKRAQR